VNCDVIAPYYRWIEYLGMGRALERRRRRFLSEVGAARRALVLGDGDGRFLRQLAARAPSARLDYVDRSAGMLKLARRAVGSERVTYHHADALEFPLPHAEYDLIATHFFFDCFGPTELDRLIERVASAAAPGAHWLVSEFRVPRRRWLEPPARIYIGGLYAFFRLATGLRNRRLVDHRPMLESRGFRLWKSEEVWGGLIASELWSR
jgi:ubiquinone/menaquinone biosynthesis C-methylase UbiE